MSNAGEPGIALSRGRTDRPTARFDRPCQDALYLSPDIVTAKVVIGGHVRSADALRVVTRYAIGRCALLDLRHPDAAALHDLARRPWRDAMTAGADPESWTAADLVGTTGDVGLIDPSRRRSGLWNITPFDGTRRACPICGGLIGDVRSSSDPASARPGTRRSD